MTNEEQVNIIIGRAKKMLPMMKSRLGDSVDGCEEYFKQSLLNMAEWKDQQFKEFLEKKKDELKFKVVYGSGGYYTKQIDTIDDIINELFKED